MNPHKHGMTRRTRASMAVLVAAMAVGMGAGTLLDGHEAEARKRAAGAATNGEQAELKIESFTNGASIALPANGQTAPSSIEVSGFETGVADVEVSLNVLSHPTTAALDILLVGPAGQTALLMSDAGDEAANDSLTFDDQAANQIPSSDNLVSGTFQPTNYDFINGPDAFAAPAPTNPTHGSSLSVFNGTNPNGTWRLFVKSQTNAQGETGTINGGWSLRITAANGVPQASPDRFEVRAGKQLRVAGPGVLGNDRDPDGDALTAVLAGKPRQGTVALAPDGSFTYKSRKSAKGTDSFTYVAEDATGLRDLETVTIRIGKSGKKGKK